jgi:hypothetical protein
MTLLRERHGEIRRLPLAGLDSNDEAASCVAIPALPPFRPPVAFKNELIKAISTGNWRAGRNRARAVLSEEDR